jgi:hypothetical protein
MLKKFKTNPTMHKIFVIYKMEKHNCRGCQHELNCARLSNIMHLQYQLASYKPRDFLDHVNAGMSAADMIEAIINAKSVEEIECIIRGVKE